MKNIFCKMVLVISALQLTACAIGPLLGGEPARSNGKGRFELSGAAGNSDRAVKVSAGLTENWDLGAQLESFSWGLRTKYALLNNQETGISLALAGGIGLNWGGSHRYGDLILSYYTPNKQWEPYIIGRYVNVKNDPLKFQDKDTGKTDFVIDVPDYNYLQGILGVRWWPSTDGWFFAAEASHASSLTKGASLERNLIAFFQAGYRFK